MVSELKNIIHIIHPLVLGVGLVCLIQVLPLRKLKKSSFTRFLLAVLLITFLFPTWNVYALNVIKKPSIALNSWLFQISAWLTGPIVYVLIREHLLPYTKRIHYFWHSLPFCLLFTYFLFFDALKPISEIPWQSKISFFNGAWIVMMVGYVLASSKTIYCSAKSRKGYFSSELKPNDRAILYLLIGYLFFVVADLAVAIGFFIDRFPSDRVNTLFEIVRLGYVLILIYKCQKLDVQSILPANNQFIELRKDKEQRLTFELATQVSKSLHNIMKDKKLYLDSDLTLRQLAEELGPGTHEVSEALNTHMQTSFYTYVNKYRLEHAKKMLEESGDTIIDIAVNSGFASRSSFYAVFKKHFNKTPKQYRDSRLEKTGYISS